MRADIDSLVYRSDRTSMRAEFTIKSLNEDEQIVTGEVYAPYVLDSHREMMLPSDLRQLAHAFVSEQKIRLIDVMHTNKWVDAAVIESFLARKGDPDYSEGAWVLSTKVFDEKVWADIRVGKINGYSLEAMVYKQEAEVVYDYLPWHFGFVEENDGHFHAFFVEVDKYGRVTKGQTGPAADGHTHEILYGTATEIGNEHAHRYFLNEIVDED